MASNWKTCAETKRPTASIGALRSPWPSRVEAFAGKQPGYPVENCWVTAGQPRSSGKARREPIRLALTQVQVVAGMSGLASAWSHQRPLVTGQETHWSKHGCNCHVGHDVVHAELFQSRIPGHAQSGHNELLHVESDQCR
jgi:hypothetical protein